jgi:hypothetical protein
MAEIWKPRDLKLLSYWVECIRDEAESKLTSWERDFIDSIEGRLAFGQQLSQKQEEILERIYAEKTN